MSVKRETIVMPVRNVTPGTADEPPAGYEKMSVANNIARRSRASGANMAAPQGAINPSPPSDRKALALPK